MLVIGRPFRGLSESIFLWCPVLPFLGYWIASYIVFNFGKYSTPPMGIGTHIFVVSYVGIFAVAYRAALRFRREPNGFCTGADDRIAIQILKGSSWLLFIGTAIFVFDRLWSGAGSLAMVQNELANIRQDYADKTTALTTLAVVPQSFRIVAVSAYFYALWRKLRISRTVHILIFLTVVVELANMALTASRGSLFWILSYVFFYFIYIRKVAVIDELFSTRHLRIKAALLTAVFGAYSYFVWVAENRVVSETAEYLGWQAYSQLKNATDVHVTDYARFGADYQIYYYFTHGFTYTDAILKHASLMNVDIISPLGTRVESQLQKLIPGYSHPAKRDILEWLAAERLDLSGWPTIFGASLAYFGIIGALAFSAAIGCVSGYSVRRWLSSRRLGWLVIVVLVFSSLNMSFDWIIRNFDQFMALFVGIFLIGRRRNRLNDIKRPSPT